MEVSAGVDCSPRFRLRTDNFDVYLEIDLAAPCGLCAIAASSFTFALDDALLFVYDGSGASHPLKGGLSGLEDLVVCVLVYLGGLLSLILSLCCGKYEGGH